MTEYLAVDYIPPGIKKPHCESRLCFWILISQKFILIWNKSIAKYTGKERVLWFNTNIFNDFFLNYCSLDNQCPINYKINYDFACELKSLHTIA